MRRPVAASGRRSLVKRLVVALGVLFCALIILGTTIATAHPAPPSPVSQPAKLRGYAGKIIAVKPPGDWTQGGGLVTAPQVFGPLAPAALPVFATDIFVA